MFLKLFVLCMDGKRDGRQQAVLHKMTQYRLALVGLNFGAHLLNDFSPGGAASPFFQLSTLCDLNESLARFHGEKCGIPWTTSLDELLGDPDIHAIALLTGPYGRAGLVDKITAAGKHVMTTKPFDTDPEAAFVLDVARSRGCGVFMNSPQTAESREDLGVIRQWMQEYPLGEPISIHSEVWASYRETADGSWYDDPSKCPVAPFFRLSIYILNDLISLFGGVESVSVATTRRFTGRPTPDNASAFLSMQNGMLASFLASFCIDDTEPYQDTVVLHFERGTIYRNLMRAVRGMPPHGDTVLDLVWSEKGERHVVQKRVKAGIGDYPWGCLHRAIAKGDFSGMVKPANVAEALRVITALGRAEISGATERVFHP